MEDRMVSERNLVRLNRGAVALGGAFALIGSAAAISMASLESWFAAYGGFMAALSLAFTAFVWLLIGQQPRNAVVWAMSAASLGAGFWLLGLGVASLIVMDDPAQVALVVSGGLLVPAEIEPMAVRSMMIAESVGLTGIYVGLTFGLLLFPDGSLPSRGWRWAARYSGLVIALSFLSALWAYRLGNTQPVNDNPLYSAGTTLAASGFVVCLVALVVRFRRSGGSERDQFKWVVWGALVFVPTIVIAITLGNSLGVVLLMAGELAFLGAFAVAVGRYRLFDVDVVISRTVVVAGLAGFITIVYAVLVGAVGLFVGFSTDAAWPLSIAATVVVAVGFQPLRQRMRRWADRLVYGERATPYEVLSRFSSQVRDAVGADDAIPYLARLLALGTGAESTAVWIHSREGLRLGGAWPTGFAIGEAAVTDGAVAVRGADYLAPVEQDGEALGAVSVTMPANESLTGAQERLIDDVASQAGMVLRNAVLIQDLHDSRQRLVAAQDEERRGIERNLHDGAQQQFVAVKLKASMVRQLVERGDDERAVELLEQVLSDLDAGVQSLRDLAHGIYPPLLEAEGLAAALRAHAGRAPIPVSVSVHDIGRYPQEVETAMYFCALEALQNAVKHADADHVDITITHEDAELAIRVSDDGDGFDPATQRRSRGLTNMSDRIEALGGRLTVRSFLSRGTSVIGRVPIQANQPPR